jgi:hypothetical protein
MHGEGVDGIHEKGYDTFPRYGSVKDVQVTKHNQTVVRCCWLSSKDESLSHDNDHEQ